MHAFQFPASKVKAALIFAASQDVRYYLNGVLFTKAPNGAGMLAVATDGHRLAAVSHEQDVSAIPDDFQVIIPRDELDKAAKNPCKAGRLEIDMAIRVEQTRTTDSTGVEHASPVTVEIRSAVTVSCPAVDGKYPDWQRVMPVTFAPAIDARLSEREEDRGPVAFASFNAAYLGDYAKAAKALGSRATNISFAQSESMGSHLVTIPGQSDFVSVLMGVRGDAPELPTWIQRPEPEEMKKAA